MVYKTNNSKGNIMEIMKKIMATALTATVFVNTINADNGKKMTLIENGKSKTVIVIPSIPNGAELESAKILADHLQQISGAKVKIFKENELESPTIKNNIIIPDPSVTDADTFIFVGEGDIVHFNLKASADEVGYGGFFIRSVGNSLILLGRDNNDSGDLVTSDNRYTPHSWGTRYAVVCFLEKYLGVRYLWPGEVGKVIPKQKTIKIPKINYTFTPTLKQRQIRVSNYGSRPQRGLDWLRISKSEYFKIKSNAQRTKSASSTWMGWQKIGGSLGVLSGDGYLLPEEIWQKWPKEHPEWFAMQLDGSREQIVKGKTAERPRLCLSNKDLIEAAAKVKIDEIKKYPYRKSVSIEIHDGGYMGFCTCKACKALDAPENRPCNIWSYDHKTKKITRYDYVALTDRVIHFYNAIAEKICKVYPDIQLCISQYSVYSAPPLKNKVHPNIVVRFVGEWYFRDKGEQSRKMMMDDWKAWSKKASKIYFRPNLLLLGYKQGNPLVNYTHKMAEDFKYMVNNSMLGTDFDSCQDMWATQGLNYYVLAKLMWNPEQNVDDIIDDYCKTGFGPAWKEIRRYWDRVEELTNKVAAKELNLLDVYPPENIAALNSILGSAKEKAKGNKAVLKRIAFLRKGLEFTNLQAEAYRMCQRRAKNKGDKKLKAEAQAMLDRKWKFMRDTFIKNPIVADMATGRFYEYSRFVLLGKEPSATALKTIKKEYNKKSKKSSMDNIIFADEKGNIVE
jgi:Domain of unknown function (DUF4838)